MNEVDSISKANWLRATLTEFEVPMLRYAQRITGSAESARDVAQDVFTRLCEQDPGVLDGRLRQWLYAVCRNRALDLRRKRGRTSRESGEAVEQVAQTDADPAVAAVGREAAERARDLVTRLPERQQEVIYLRFTAGLSYRQIAEVTGLKVSHVGYLIHTGIKTIREQMPQETKTKNP